MPEDPSQKRTKSSLTSFNNSKQGASFNGGFLFGKAQGTKHEVPPLASGGTRHKGWCPPTYVGGQLFDGHKAKRFLLMPDPHLINYSYPIAYCLVPVACQAAAWHLTLE